MNLNILYIASSGRCRMNRWTAFLFVVANLLVSSVHARAKMKKYLWLQELRPCANEPLEARLNGSFMYTGHGSFHLSLDAYIPRKLNHLYLFVDMKKCPTMQKTDDCEDMMSFPVGDQCLPDAYFKYLYTQFQPPISCPVLGLHRARNAVLETDNHMSFFRGLTEEEWLHVYVDVYPDEKRLKKKELCVVIIATMKKIRVQEKTNQKKKQ